MPQIPVGQTVNFTVGPFNSITRNPSQQVVGTWYYSIKGTFELGDKLQGTAQLIHAMLGVWPGTGGTMSITRGAQDDYHAIAMAAGVPGPPKLEEYNPVSRSYNVIAAAARAEDCPDMIGEAGTAAPLAAAPVTAAAAPGPLHIHTNEGHSDPQDVYTDSDKLDTVVTGPPTLTDLFALAEACVAKAADIMEATAEAGWTVDTGTMISLAQTMQNNAWRSGLRVEVAPPPQEVEEPPQAEAPPLQESPPPKTMAEATSMVDNLFNQ